MATEYEYKLCAYDLHRLGAAGEIASPKEILDAEAKGGWRIIDSELEGGGAYMTLLWERARQVAEDSSPPLHAA